MNGLTILVYRNGSDCTNGGISASHDRLTLLGKGISGPFEPTEEHPAVTVVQRTIGGEIYRHLVPCDPKTAEPLPGWYMFGGNFGYSSDSRYKAANTYPLPIHDRKE